MYNQCVVLVVYIFVASQNHDEGMIPKTTTTSTYIENIYTKYYIGVGNKRHMRGVWAVYK